ncbi:glycoside hydrolase superfamily [Rhexocercosporidium sp. MPI-PUGE-AT-0058]|nr:glycoside hydrolase superfamily [Rhexocercosporidium sp. MPI-PUGE-AT-0058]
MADQQGQRCKAVYLDSTLDPQTRATALLSLMTLEEKAGLLFHGILTPVKDMHTAITFPFILPSVAEMVGQKHLNHFNLLGPIEDAKSVAIWHNSLQKLALEETRLGIPITVSTDPRNHFTDNVGTSFHAGVLSQWPETLGIAALRDVRLTETFADIARREYIALGFRCALHPQVDLATEYRWSRINATFGEDAELSGQQVEACIRGFHGASSDFGKDSVSTMTKHFPGGGAQGNDGEDSHFAYGQDQTYPAGMFDYHLQPFRNAIRAGTRQMMPYYSKPVGTQHEEVGFAFNKSIIDGLLRKEMGFEGIVCTDWGIISDCEILGQEMPARAWGCEKLSELERVVKALDAGCDQFGGEWKPELVVEAVRSGRVSEERVSQSARKLLIEKFTMGLFDENRFVNVDAVNDIVGRSDFRQLGFETQRKSYTLLQNKDNVLPLSESSIAGKKFYIEGIKLDIAHSWGLSITDQPSQADIAILRLQAPFEPLPGAFEATFHRGSLNFPAAEISRFEDIFSAVPVVIVDVYLDRPAILTPLAKQASALLVNFGASAQAFLDVIMGRDMKTGERVHPEGRLPFDLPRSMEAVRESKCDEPFSTADPLFRFGDGVKYF